MDDDVPVNALAGTIGQGELMSIEKIDDYTLDFTFSHPNPLFLEFHSRGSYHSSLFVVPEHYLRQRIRMAKQHLRGEDDSVTTIAFALGFSSSQYFSTVFKRLTGITPGQYRELMRNRF